MKKETYTCDVCGDERKDANHWFLVETDVDHACATNPRSVGMSIHPWNHQLVALDGIKHVCGQVCAHKLLDQFLSGELK